MTNTFDDNLIRKRSLPGVLVFNEENCLVFLNEEAMEILTKYHRHETAPPEDGPITVPEQVYELIRSVLDRKESPEAHEKESNYSKVLIDGNFYAIRAVPLYRSGETGLDHSHILINIQKCVARRGFDLDAVRTRFNLTKREAEVVLEIIQGASNHQIASNLYISKYTVKDHIRHIMCKFQVNSRTLIINKAIEACA